MARGQRSSAAQASPDGVARGRRPTVGGDALAFAAGAVTPLAFSPYGIFAIAPLAAAVLFYLCSAVSGRRAFWRGWLFGFGLFAFGVYWVYHSMHVYGYMPPLLAGLFTVVFAALLALYPGLALYFATRFFRVTTPWRLLLVYPAVWTLAEWLRGWLLTGFPWLDLGYSQVAAPLGGLAAYVGVYGVTWAVAFSGGLLALLLHVRLRTGAILLSSVAVLWAVAWLLGTVSWTAPAGAAFSVSLIQGNVPQEIKWQRGARAKILQQYAAATRTRLGTRLIVWPETAIPVFYSEVANDYLRPLAAAARAKGTDLLMGLPVRDPASGKYYNAMLSLDGRSAFYFKRHLVPFGEYVPLRGLLDGLLDLMHVPMSSFSKGAWQQQPPHVAGYPVGISICYEIAFGAEVITTLPQAAFLVNASNNSWFGDSSAPYQVLEMARMRARESQRYVLSATNNGMTAIIDDAGRVRREAPRARAVILDGTVEPRTGSTTYVRWGNVPVITALVMSVLAGLWSGRRARRRRPSPAST